MSLYEIMLKNLQVAEQIGQIKEINMQGKTEYLSEGCSIRGETVDGKLFTLKFELEDKEENHA